VPEQHDADDASAATRRSAASFQCFSAERRITRVNWPSLVPEVVTPGAPWGDGQGDSVNVTLSLGAKTVEFFTAEAAKRGVPYEGMIRRLLDAYVEAFGGEEVPASDRRAGKTRQLR
jgi:hypothetical protein